MSVSSRVGLLLDLAVLDPPPFQSEEFARWCCQATTALLARDMLSLNPGLPLAPGVFTAFTATIPGLEDLPRLSDRVDKGPAPIRTRARPTAITPDGEEVDVLLVIYEIVRVSPSPFFLHTTTHPYTQDRLSPYRVVAKGKKLGALVGFTFRQPAVIQALGLAPNTRELSSYLMYEPFQQAWTKAVQPSQTVTVCEGGGAIYRHPRVNVTLWLDSYVIHIYPDWVRQGLALHDLAAIAAENDGAPDQPARAPAAKHALALPAPAAVPAQHPFLALPAPAVPAQRPVLALPAPAVRAQRSLLTLLAPAVKPKRPLLTLTASKASVKEVGQPRSTASADSPTASLPVRTGGSASTHVVIDLTVDADQPKRRRGKRSLEVAEALVDLRTGREESGPHRKRQRRFQASVKLEGKGTEQDPYIV